MRGWRIENGGWRRDGHSRSAILPFLAFLLALTPLALAQPEPERLPDLTPRAFEIRGDLQISLPNLERQPLRGFAPPPRTYVVPANRRTFVAPYRQRLDDLPADPLACTGRAEIATLNPLTGRIDAGLGRYSSRLGRITVSRGGLGIRAAYSGFSDGPSDFSADSDVFDGRVAYTSPGPTRFGFDLGGAYRSYSFLDTSPLVDPSSQPQWSGRTIDGGASVASDAGRTAFDAALRFSSTATTLDIESVFAGSSSSTDFSETRLEASGGVQTDRVRLDAGGALAGLGDEDIGESLTSYSAGGTLRLDVGRGRLDVGARVLGYDASEANGGGSSTVIGPVARFETPLSPATRFYLRTDPRVTDRGLAGLYRENPYAVAEPFVAPDIDLIDGEGGVEIQSRNVRFTAYGGLRLSPVRRYFERETAGSAPGLYAARYGEATVVRGGGSATLYTPSGVRATAEVEVRSATLDAGTDLGGNPVESRDLPYFAPLTGGVSLAVPFAAGRGLVQATGYAESSRPTETAGVDAGGWATLDAEAHYWFASGFGVLVRGERLAGRAERWPGFPRPPATFLAGLRVRW